MKTMARDIPKSEQIFIDPREAFSGVAKPKEISTSIEMLPEELILFFFEKKGGGTKIYNNYQGKTSEQQLLKSADEFVEKYTTELPFDMSGQKIIDVGKDNNYIYEDTNGDLNINVRLAETNLAAKKSA